MTLAGTKDNYDLFSPTASVSVLPDTLWVSNAGIHNVVDGHVILVYCSATGFTAPTITWTKDGTEVSHDPPHIFIRTSVDGLTSVLTIDQFNTSDDGAYVCSANGVSGSTTSGPLTLTSKSVGAVNSSVQRVISISDAVIVLLCCCYMSVSDAVKSVSTTIVMVRYIHL